MSACLETSVCEGEREKDNQANPNHEPCRRCVVLFFIFCGDKSEKCDSFSNSSFLLKKLQTSLFSKLHQTNPNK